ncbi:anti-sigma factor family protein [Sulfuriroseicoccus oceanibius]|uniref:Anti-sigma factor n=1 Tax=Sulfuriroseicoccus oceanibius TaxID=2707525 RepID=A0A6B3L0I9_9BACT|nr:hypothetical protein [Sulfuriroseicoccus oceanibius]QQL43889.1 hypothetical protein G3M56_008265 [Sulfuriroseicoccus oceanibius]
MKPTEQQLAEWIDGTLPPDELRQLEAWLDENPAERDELEAMRAAGRAVGATQGVPDEIPAAEFFMHQLERRIDAESSGQPIGPADSQAPAATVTKLPWMRLVIPPIAAAAVAVTAAVLTIRYQNDQQQSREGQAVAPVMASVDEKPRVYAPRDEVVVNSYYESGADAQVVVLEGLPEVDASMQISGFGRDSLDRGMWAELRKSGETEVTGTDEPEEGGKPN